MPKFSKAFGRRKSNTNVFEDIPDVPAAESTFKVFERPEGSKSFDGGVKFSKAINGPAARPKTAHLEDDNMFHNIGNNRGSGASNTNTASTADNSSRLSAASTAPSSTDVSGREEWRSPHDKPFSDIPVPPIPKSSSAFSLKNAGRSLSWGRNKPIPSPPKEASSPTIEEEPAASRDRALTTSSYASTATPPKLEKDLGLSLGGDFSDMFSGFGKRKSVVMEPADNRAKSHSPTRPKPPAPLTLDPRREVEASPYSWSSHHSNEGLMSSASPPPFAPRHDERGPPVPQHNAGHSRPQRPGAPVDTGLRRSSGFSGKRQSTFDSVDAVDEDARLLRESVNASRRMNNPDYSANVRDSWALPSTPSSYPVEDATISSWAANSVETTPKARKPVPEREDDDLFDTQIAASADLASRFQQRSVSPPSRNAPPQNKVMTPAQFERYKQDQERLRSVGGQPKDEEEDEEEPYDDDEDEAEKNRQLAKQRRKQEAHMAVYRQQMMKVTGEAPSGPPTSHRPSVFATQSSPNLALPGNSASDSNEEEDEEVPLAILQAHGFPNKNKPPMRSAGSNPNLRASAQMAGGNPADPRLPVFARNLPQDPYFGASVVNPMNRESLAFGGGGGGSVAGSAHGGPSRGLPPGGLVGVIATEERSRAMRRGSPNPQGDYGPPANGFNGMGMPPNQRASTAGSMMNGMMPGQMGQMGPMGPMNPMMMTPGDQAQMQMSQQMQQFMQMQMQFMQMMTAGQGQGQAPPQLPQMSQMPPMNGHMSQQSMGSMPRPGSPSLRPGSAQQQRAMTMLEPNAAPWMQNGHGSMYAPSIHAQGGYTPSIAPSERSNVGLPGRYRPVSSMPPADTKSRTSTMTGALQGWENKNGSATVKPVKKSGNNSDEDDEEGWEEMAKKREKKKSKWRSKKGDSTNGLKDMLGYA
ncbi:hypothetical protein LSUE1_G005044 [Lachnellula suecica]|uniref:Uncharacterized protein n=1 Tax=Lachnellula suecica TaxID=602035 RepID=A0A8T9C1G4_9HELO|nr:hypothetical protein LSUE1_G005044 [Lachnellula suecica]